MESAIQTAIQDYLQLLENQGRLVYIKNNSGAIPVQGKFGRQRFVRFGKKGSSDFLAFMNGYTLFLEVKAPKGRQSKFQKAFQQMVEGQGFEYHIVYSVDEVEIQVKKYLD